MTNDISQRFKRMYNDASDAYDYSRYEKDHGKVFRELSEDLAIDLVSSLLRDNERETLILDFATGTGKVVNAIKEFELAKIIGLDISINMLSKAKPKIISAHNNVLLVNGDGLKLPFKDDTFNHIVSFKFLHIMENVYHYQFLKELHRVLKPNGKLIMDCNNGIFGIFLKLRDKSYRIKRPSSRFYWPHHRYTLYKEFTIIQVLGEWFPFTAFLQKISKNLAAALNKSSRHFPFNFLCGKLVLVFRKK